MIQVLMYVLVFLVSDPLNPVRTGIGTTEIEEETVAKEMEHAQLQDSLDKELEELNKRLEQKEVFLYESFISHALIHGVQY